MIEAFKGDEVFHKLGGRFRTCVLIQKRLVELMEGARPLVERGSMSDLELVVEEILQDKITIATEDEKRELEAQILLTEEDAAAQSAAAI